MPAAEVPSTESPKAEPGQSTEAVGAVGRSNISNRIANTALSLALLGGFLILGGCSATPSASSALPRQHQGIDLCQEPAEAYSSHRLNTVDPPSFPRQRYGEEAAS